MLGDELNIPSGFPEALELEEASGIEPLMFPQCRIKLLQQELFSRKVYFLPTSKDTSNLAKEYQVSLL